MDRSRQRELLPHYLAVLVVTGAFVWGLHATLDGVAPWLALAVVVFVVLTYPTVVRLLGFSPDEWES